MEFLIFLVPFFLIMGIIFAVSKTAKHEDSHEDDNEKNNITYQHIQVNRTQVNTNSKKNVTWYCPCGKMNTSLYCSACGNKNPMDASSNPTWVCPSCKSRNTGLFCFLCGCGKNEKPNESPVEEMNSMKQEEAPAEEAVVEEVIDPIPTPEATDTSFETETHFEPKEPVHEEVITPVIEETPEVVEPTQEEVYSRMGYDKDGYDERGYDRRGYDRDGYDEKGYDYRGYDKDGYDEQGYDKRGYDRSGFDQFGYDRDGFNRDGVDLFGNKKS